MSIMKKGGVVVITDDSCPIASAIAENIFSGGEGRKPMPNFVKMAFENKISALPNEINSDFVRGLAEIAKKAVSYEKSDWPWEYSEDLEWFFHDEKNLEKITRVEGVSQEEKLISIGVFLSMGEFFSIRGSEAIKEMMHRLRDSLFKSVRNKEEALVVSEYAGKNGKSRILVSWF